MGKLKNWLMVGSLVVLVVGMLLPVAIWHEEVAASETNIMVTVPASSREPLKTVVNPIANAVKIDPAVDVIVEVENVTTVGVWLNGNLECYEYQVPLVGGFGTTTCPINIGGWVGEHEIVVLGTRDYYREPLMKITELTVVFDPNFVPNPGVLRIGGMTVAMRGYIASCVVIVMLAMTAIGFVFLRKKQKNEEEARVKVVSRR